MHISPETIYCWFYAAAQPGDTSCRHLRRAPTEAVGGKAGTAAAALFLGRIDIARWPQSVADRSRFGDWEAEPVYASRGKAALVSCNECESRFLLLGKAQNKTATWAGACSASNLRTYFYRPHSPWRGTNEHSNGLLRQYFPRGISLHNLTEELLRNAAERLNKRPREWLTDQTR